MGRLVRAPLIVAGLLAAPLIAIAGQNRESDGSPDARGIDDPPTRARSHRARWASSPAPSPWPIRASRCSASTMQVEGTQLGANTTPAGAYRIT